MINQSNLHERLTRLIGDFANTAQESRQVARRLADLLETRFSEIRREHQRTMRVRGGDADRLALTDPRYVAAVEEYCEMSAQATMARVQYETHAMLYKARQSLRALRR